MDGVADAGDGAVVGDGDLLGARGGEAGGVAAVEVVGEGGVGPEGLDRGVAVVGALRDEQKGKTMSWGALKYFCSVAPDLRLYND